MESSFWYNLMQKENWFLVWFNQWYLWIFYQIFLNLYFDKRNQPGQHLQVTFHVFFKSNLLSDIKSRKLILILFFDRKNPANWFEFLLWHENSNKFIWICVLTKEINLINIYRLHIYHIFSNFLFDRKNLENWVEFCVLTGKIK